MKKPIILAVLALPLLLWQCSVSRQISEAKALGQCQYNLVSADSVSLSGYDIREFKSMTDINPIKYPRIATGLLTRNVPLNARINLEITNPTNKNAGINQLEYRIIAGRAGVGRRVYQSAHRGIGRGGQNPRTHPAQHQCVPIGNRRKNAQMPSRSWYKTCRATPTRNPQS